MKQNEKPNPWAGAPRRPSERPMNAAEKRRAAEVVRWTQPLAPLHVRVAQIADVADRVLARSGSYHLPTGAS